MWRIKSAVEKDDESGEPLYWSNEDGWVSQGTETVFTDESKSEIQYLPLHGEWEQVTASD